MKIGITERGDAGLDYTWHDKLANHEVNGAVLITKNISPLFIKKVMELYNAGFTQIIIHCGCTGWGETIIEPNVPQYKTQLQGICDLIRCGFPINNLVLRIDPIFPTQNGLRRVCKVIEHAKSIGLLPQIRVRISVLDEYKHVKERFKELGYQPIYGDSFYAPKQMMDDVVKTLSQFDIQFECCAENLLSNGNQFIHTGCISERDLRIMGLDIPTNMLQNMQQRNGCKCLSCKTELLTQKHQCPHKCAYCYWRNK